MRTNFFNDTYLAPGDDFETFLMDHENVSADLEFDDEFLWSGEIRDGEGELICYFEMFATEQEAVERLSDAGVEDINHLGD